jgi:hypothetical protein
MSAKFCQADTDMPPRDYSLPRRPALAAALFCAIAALLTFAFILIDGVNVPFADEWWYADLVKSVESGQATFNSFWAPNNEHRMLIPRLEFSTLAVLTHWNSKVMMIAGWLVVVVAMIFLFSQFRRIYSRRHPKLWIAAVGVSAAALFSLVQMENWLWAFQFAFFFIQFALIASLIILCQSNIALWLRLLAAAALGAAASFSSAQGLLVWPALMLSLSLTNDSPKKKIIGLFCLLISAATTFFLYFHGLPRTTELHLRAEQIIEKVQLPIFGFFGLVGNPLTRWISYEHLPHRAWFIGLSITIVFLFLTSIVIKRRRIPDAAPWLGLAAYAYSFCLVTTYGRLGMGYTGGFLAGRYTTHVSLLLIAILALVLIAMNSVDAESTRHHASSTRISVLAAFGLTLSFAVFLAIGDVQSFRSGAIERRDRLLAKRLIPFATYFDPDVDGTMTGPFYPLCPLRCRMIFDFGLKQLSESGYFGRLDNVNFLDEAVQATGNYSVTGKIVEERYLGLVEQGWKLSGAVSLGRKYVANLIFFKPAGSGDFVAATELQQTTDHGDAGRSYEWRMFLSPFILPDPEIPLEMWVYNQQSNEFLKIHQNAEHSEKADSSKMPP